MGAKRGLDLYLYCDFGAGNILLSNVRDLQLPLEKGFGDASRRTSQVKQGMPTMHDPEFSWEMVNDPADTGLSSIQAAWLADTKITLRFADGPIATSGTTYRSYEAYFTSISEAQPLDGVSMVSVKAKPAYTSSAQGSRTTV